MPCYVCKEKIKSGKLHRVNDICICDICHKFSLKNFILVCKECGNVISTAKNEPAKIAIMKSWAKFREYEKPACGSLVERGRFEEECFVISFLEDNIPCVISILCSEACMKKYGYKMAIEWGARKVEHAKTLERELHAIKKHMEETSERIRSLKK